MLKIQKNGKRSTRLIVQPNRSMSWRANLWLGISLSIICVGIGLVMASFGLWVILPFAGAESIAVFTCLWLTQRKLSRLEVITVGDEVIRLEWGYHHPDTTVDLPRQWSRISYHLPDSEWENGELSVSAHGKRYTLGGCLNREEKRSLHEALQSALLRASSAREHTPSPAAISVAS